MRERPIPFNSEMIRAILAGGKTQTRRPIHPDIASVIGDSPDYVLYRCPFGQIGDRLWVRETWREEDLEPGKYWYRADWSDRDLKELFQDQEGGWKSSRYMPRRASRVLLEITDVRVERVQDITNKDIESEGACSHACVTHRLNFSVLWDSCYSDRGLGWDANPWVWVISFKKIEPKEKREAAQ